MSFWLFVLSWITLSVGSLVGFTPTWSEFSRHGSFEGDAWMHQHYPHIVLRMLAVGIALTVLVVGATAAFILRRESSLDSGGDDRTG